MKLETQIAQALGLIDGTLGSVRGYTTEDYKRRLEMAACLLRGEKYSPETIQKDMERQNTLDSNSTKARIDRVREALQTINDIYGFTGESGTEELMSVFDNALVTVFGVIRQSHEDEGLFADCIYALACALDEEAVSAHGAPAQ